VEFRFVGPAHTWGDMVAYLPERKILFAADLAFFYLIPYCHNAYVSKWMESMEKVLKMDVDTIVPGHGPVAGKKELNDSLEYFRFLKTEVKKRYDAKMTPGAAAADIKMGKYDNWMGPERLLMNTVRLYNEFKGTLKPDIDVEGTKQAIVEYNAIKAKKG
jgi:cyclase